ncbi:MAG TPA: VOC family protein [Aestuariivirga sp.]|nr:VOC family protein [Aestuariivirga sp.]
MRADHLVWYCANLAEGGRYFTERMDHPPAYGGVHPGEGTGNRLLSLSDKAYLEILGRDPAQPESALAPEIRGLKGHGLYHWAVGDVDLGALRHRVQAAGLTGGDLVEGGRTLPNGKWLGWKCFGLHNHPFGALVPFFIDWMESEHPAKTAPRGGRLKSIEVFSPEAKKLRKLYDILRLEIAVKEGASPGLAATIASGSGEHVLRMFDPVPQGYVI